MITYILRMLELSLESSKLGFEKDLGDVFCKWLLDPYENVQCRITNDTPNVFYCGPIINQRLK